MLTHTVRIASRGSLGRAIAALEIGLRGQRALERVYRRIDAAVSGKLGNDAAVDPFEPAAEIPRAQRNRLDEWIESLEAEGIDPLVAERLGDFLARAPAPAVARIRPLALARQLELDADAVVEACLRGARDGVLILLWDILCPACRIPSQVLDSLRVLREHGHCEACRLDFELDFASSVELIFRAHPDLRDTELGTYCIGGPAHSPHVAAQARVGPGERLAIDLALSEGSYRVRGPQIAFRFDFRVASEARDARLELGLTQVPGPELPQTLRSGGQVLAFNNEGATELLVRVERMASRDDALTAARASTLALFRTLFPGELLSPGQLVSLATVTLLVTELDQGENVYHELGDTRAFALVHEQFRRLGDCVREHGGAVVKTVNEGMVAVFPDPVSAVEAALAFDAALAGSERTRGLAVRVGVHRGSAMVATLNDHLDYFGSAVHLAARLPRLAEGGGIIITPAVARDPRITELLDARRFHAQVLPVALAGLQGDFVHRLTRRGESVPDDDRPS